MLHYIKKYPFTILIFLLICYLSLFKPPKTDLDEVPNIDKIAHVCMYGGWGLIIWIEYLRSHRSLNKFRLWTGAIIGPILFSGCIELIQEYGTTYRGGDWLDLLANSLGILAAAVVGYFWIRPSFSKHPQWLQKGY